MKIGNELPEKALRKPELNWEGDSFLKIDDVSFIVVYDERRMKTETSRGQTFVLAKSRRQLEIIHELQFEKPIQYVFEQSRAGLRWQHS